MKIQVKKLERFDKQGYGIYIDNKLIDTALDFERAKRYAKGTATNEEHKRLVMPKNL